MSKIYTTILCSILSIGIIKPQTVLVGTGLGPDILIFDGGVATGINLNLSLNVQLNRVFELEFKPGLAGNSGDFNGFEFSSSIKIFPFNSGVHFLGGFKFHSNLGQERISVIIRDDLYILPTLGIGYKTKVQKTFVTFDLVYQKPFPRGVHSSFVANEFYYTTDFNAVVSLNIGFAWQIY